MSNAHHRKKNPKLVRNALMSAAVTLLEEGSPVSIGAIADAAGVTKGAVQHHFGTREQLMLALSESMITEFAEETAVIEDGAPAGAARSYLRAIEAPDEKQVTQSRAILCAAVMERGVAAQWRDFVKQHRELDHGNDEQQLGMLICRLAADGLWLSDILKTYNIDAQMRHRLLKKLESIATGEIR